MRGQLHHEECITVAYEMLNDTPALFDRLALRPTQRRKLEHLVRRTMRVLIGHREFVPRAYRRYVRPLRRSER